MEDTTPDTARYAAEVRKFIAEADKLEAEKRKLYAEEHKLWTDARWAPFASMGTSLAALIVALLALFKALP